MSACPLLELTEQLGHRQFETSKHRVITQDLDRLGSHLVVHQPVNSCRAAFGIDEPNRLTATP